MDRIVPWKRLRRIVRPFYYQGEGVGRRPIDLERMLRICFLQHWFNLSDPAVEETLYDMISMRAFARVDLGETSFCSGERVRRSRHSRRVRTPTSNALPDVGACHKSALWICPRTVARIGRNVEQVMLPCCAQRLLRRQSLDRCNGAGYYALERITRKNSKNRDARPTYDQSNPSG
jgi:hypothetical protein